MQKQLSHMICDHNMAEHADTAPNSPGEEVIEGDEELFTLRDHQALNIYVHCSPDDGDLLCWTTYANVSSDTLENWANGWHPHLGSLYDEVEDRFKGRELVWWFPCFDGETGMPASHWRVDDYVFD